jgi:glycosyltransferase involved in cell wall biosynthesis
MGRLVRQKGFDLLVEAFARVASMHPDWRVVILGEGAERANLTASIHAAGLVDRVSLAGFASAPERAMRQADLFVLPSRFEGFPNSLLEAMAEGMPCISFDCPTGPKELIEHDVSGWLVPAEDVAALAKGLDMLMGSAELRIRLGAQARGVQQSYSLAAILDKWNRLLESLSERPAPRVVSDRAGDKARSHG